MVLFPSVRLMARRFALVATALLSVVLFESRAAAQVGNPQWSCAGVPAGGVSKVNVLSGCSYGSGVFTITGGGGSGDVFSVSGSGKISCSPTIGNVICSHTTTGTAGSKGSASSVPVFTTDSTGHVSANTNTAIAIDASQTTTGTFACGRLPAFTGDATKSSGSCATVVSGLQGNAVSSSTPTSNQALVWNGSAWTPTALAQAQITGGYVDLVNAQSVGGAKTFSTIPIADGMSAQATPTGPGYLSFTDSGVATGDYETNQTGSRFIMKNEITTATNLIGVYAKLFFPSNPLTRWFAVLGTTATVYLEMSPGGNYSAAFGAQYVSGLPQIYLTRAFKFLPEWDGADCSDPVGYHCGTVNGGAEAVGEYTGNKRWRAVGSLIHEGPTATLGTSGAITWQPVTSGEQGIIVSSGNVSSITISLPVDAITPRVIDSIHTRLILVQGNASYTWPTTITNAVLPAGIVPKQSTALNDVDVIDCTYSYSQSKYYCDVRAFGSHPTYSPYSDSRFCPTPTGGNTGLCCVSNGSAWVAVACGASLSTLTLGTGLTGTSYNGSAPVTAAVSYGTSSGTACQGNDTRLPPTPSGAGKIIYDTGSAYAAITAGSSGQCLKSGGAGAPTWGSCTTGGTNATSLQGVPINSATPVATDVLCAVDIGGGSIEWQPCAQAVASPGTAGHILVDSGSAWASQAMSGDATIAAGGALTLANSGVSAGTYGAASQVGVCAIDAKGRATSCTNTSIAIAGTQITSSQVPAARGGTAIDTSGSTGVPRVSAGTWSILSVLTAALGGTGIDTSASTGLPSITAGTWSVITRVSSALGGTGVDTSASTGVPTISSGTWSVNTLLPINRGGTNASAIGSAGSIPYSSGGSAYGFSNAYTAGYPWISGGTGAPVAVLPTGVGIDWTIGAGALGLTVRSGQQLAAGGTLVHGGTSGNTDVTLYTTGSVGAGGFILYQIMCKVSQAMVSSDHTGSTTITIGTSAGGTQYYTFPAITDTTGLGTVFGWGTQKNTATFTAAQDGNAVLGSSSSIVVRAASTGTVGTEAQLNCQIYGGPTT